MLSSVKFYCEIFKICCNISVCFFPPQNLFLYGIHSWNITYSYDFCFLSFSSSTGILNVSHVAVAQRNIMIIIMIIKK